MATVNEVFPLAIQLEKRETNLYPRVYIYISSQEIGQSPIALNHISRGAYYNQFIPSSEAYYHLQSNVYTNASFTISSTTYGSGFETIKVDSMETEIGWISSQGISINMDELEAEMDYVSSQVHNILIPDIEYISSQVDYISGATEKFGYGGGTGGGETYIVGSKSPWTHKQRDTIIKTTEDTKKKVDELSKDTKNYHKDEIKEITNTHMTIVTRIDNLIDNLSMIKKGMEKLSKDKDSREILKEITNAIKSLEDYKKEVNTLSSDKDLKRTDKNVKILMGMVIKLLPDKEIEKLYVENKK